MRTAPLWVITQRVVVIRYRLFGTAVRRCHHSLCTNPEDRRFQYFVLHVRYSFVGAFTVYVSLTAVAWSFLNMSCIGIAVWNNVKLSSGWFWSGCCSWCHSSTAHTVDCHSKYTLCLIVHRPKGTDSVVMFFARHWFIIAVITVFTAYWNKLTDEMIR